MAPGGIQYAVELRNPSWFGPDLLDLLRSHGVALALTDLTLTRGDGGKYGPPTGPELLDRLGEEIWTADFLFVRWLGDRVGIEALTETWERVVQARNEELGRWSELLAGAAARGRDVHAYANNHYEGFAPETIRKVRALLADRAGDPRKVC